jgi:DNA-binding MarR family transcriptional regulator
MAITDQLTDAGAPSLLYLIKQVELVVRSRLDEVVAPYGVTTSQYTALSVLARHPGITAAQLARNSFVRTQTMAQLIGYLEERGLLRRERDARIRRQILIFLTDEGQRVIDELAEPIAELEAEIIAALPSAQARVLPELLGRIRHALSGSHPH